ncbi:MAG TPA: hypothetical protein VNN07_13125, partial [Candidatus Tectomicrobia bacterium]|nr:hypothetical protein [Candidatus Tectomicrobia bacterium]
LNVDRHDLDAALGAEAAGAIALAEAVGRVVDRNRFAAKLLNRLDDWYATWRAHGAAAVLAAFRERDALQGHAVDVRSPSATSRGRACGIDEDGALLVQFGGEPPRRVVTERVYPVAGVLARRALTERG